MLYNYARLCSIFHHFEQCVQQGEVAPLPPAEDVDFSLLRHDVSFLLHSHHTPQRLTCGASLYLTEQLFLCHRVVI